MHSSSAENLLQSVVDPTDHSVGDVRPPTRRPTPILRIARTDLAFRFEADGMIDVTLRVTNPGPAKSPPRRGRIAQAVFGAFVPTTPLTTFSVPTLAPGEMTIIKLRVPRVALGGDGSPPDSPAQELLAPPTTLREPATPSVRGPDEFRRRIAALIRSLIHGEENGPAATPLHFAGNLDVHIGPATVERHLSGRVRIHRGKLNMVTFDVGTGPDAYCFRLLGEGANWKPALTRFSLQVGDARQGAIVPDTWYEWSGACETVVLEFVPPEKCRRGGLDVEVEQRSSGRIAQVEFDLDPDV
jgi:hypothetical protein